MVCGGMSTLLPRPQTDPTWQRQPRLTHAISQTWPWLRMEPRSSTQDMAVLHPESERHISSHSSRAMKQYCEVDLGFSMTWPRRKSEAQSRANSPSRADRVWDLAPSHLTLRLLRHQ